ncbi:hypothetical protein [Rubrivivax gelatinosus]|uniref:Uncharacterized protein n=1 Tax=Rubrivivax gelatinosus (strain NBRC 100245 / IL144) TaxID=983917 RepID=I0HRA1_RUBGI|nr:hypothetical protein [Rubrivivax gelatinosus]BAL95538.1 hypothetical protein RGE_21970 [Rubrivivax gelatinosus IL144]
MSTEVISQSLAINLKSSKIAHNHGVVVSFREWVGGDPKLVVGSPGQPNVIRVMQLGDAVLYETLTHGLIEVRLTDSRSSDIVVLLTCVSPRLGFSAAFDESDIQNAPFSTDEVTRIESDIASIKESMSSRADIEADKLELLYRKLDEIAAASRRMGRKDWAMFVAGTLTNVIVGAAFSPEAARALLVVTNSALGWIFQNALRLLSA